MSEMLVEESRSRIVMQRMRGGRRVREEERKLQNKGEGMGKCGEGLRVRGR